MNIYIIIINLFISIPISSVEIVFPSGDAFLVEIISEDSRTYKVKYKENIYTIPKNDLEKIDLLKQGKDRSYTYLDFNLKDGSKIKGIVAEENTVEYIIQSELGFVTISKSSLKGDLPDTKKSASFDPKYSFSEPLIPETRIGIFCSNMISSSIPVISRSGGLYLEPSYFKYSKFQFGYKLQYDSFKNKSDYNILHNQFYLQYPIKFANPLLDFYFQIGGGFSDISYKSNYENHSGLEGSFLLESGWQGWKWNNLYSRISIKTIGIKEQSGIIFLNGIEFGIGIRL
ncbi:MAG: hypothetical protein KDK54_21715 [Leptospiraceae bacterium]|nr:hypothetical protein [Leptospiraceae bacterium]